MPAQAAEALGVPGQHALEQEDEEEEDEAEGVEGQGAQGVLLPAHVLRPVHPEELVEAPLTGAQDGGEEDPLPVHDPADVAPQGDGQGHQDGEIDAVLQDSVHSQPSPFKSVTLR